MTDTVSALKITAEVIGSLTVIIGVIVAVYKYVDNNKRQNAAIQSMQEEQTVICYAVQGCLQGLIEQGCDGPCKEALAMLQKHLNKKAHSPNL